MELQAGSREALQQIMLARYYSASLGRFLRPDPGFDADLTIPQSWNMYSYVRNNPIVGIDPYGEDTYYVNRKLNSPHGPPVSKYNPLSHQLLVTTGPPTAEHPNGVVEHTSSWSAGESTLDDEDDIEVAQQGLDEEKGRWAGGEDLDPKVEAEMQATQDPNHPSHHTWGIWRTCKGEARRTVHDAKKKQKAENSADPEKKERKQPPNGNPTLNFSGPTYAGSQPRVLIDGVDVSDPYTGR